MMARDDDNIISYGSLDQKTESDSPLSSQNISISHDVVNHGHPYSDAIVDTIVSDHSRSDNNVTYWSLIRDNDGFRYYLMSYLVTHAGEWFTYVATISCIEEIQHFSNDTISRTSISILVSLRLLPSGLFSSIGPREKEKRIPLANLHWRKVQKKNKYEKSRKKKGW